MRWRIFGGGIGAFDERKISAFEKRVIQPPYFEVKARRNNFKIVTTRDASFFFFFAADTTTIISRPDKCYFEKHS